ncbi:unnamed protein product [Bemisia tabaci]|uniref:E3 ubiquitin-protein ligase parkin n=1 Tax=Bemisia tabaci TaxID=7038 RepID=A0A9P0G2E5_BEMTA|nr:unnamed protein product [Bemisia tabaci]
MSLLSILFDFFQSVFHLIWFSRNSITNSLSIYVKSNTGNTVSVDLDPKWDIKNVKEVVAPRLGLEPEEVKIIFAGKELPDSVLLEECDLGQQSILHAVKSRKKLVSESKPLCETLLDFSLSEISERAEEEETTLDDDEKIIPEKAHFYVYCASPCKGMRTGKLRVRCANCKSGAITVDRDPQSWADVLESERISGHCEEETCSSGPISWVEFYFKCAEHTSQGEMDQAVPLYLIRPNSQHVPCLACGDVSDPVLVFSCSVGHVTCLECFNLYCVSRLRERQFTMDETHGYTLPCPAGCEDSLIKEIHHFHLLNDEHYAMYQRFGMEEYVLKNGGVLCPQPGCGAGILVEPDCTRITCAGGCGYVFCRNCLQGYHIGECETVEEIEKTGTSSYAVNPECVSQARWDEASKVAIKVTTKPCPKCRTATERDGGCMHMLCTRCAFQWCWVCQIEWNRDCMGRHWFG